MKAGISVPMGLRYDVHVAEFASLIASAISGRFVAQGGLQHALTAHVIVVAVHGADVPQRISAFL